MFIIKYIVLSESFMGRASMASLSLIRPDMMVRAINPSSQRDADLRPEKNNAARGAKNAHTITTLPLAKPPKLHINRNGRSKISNNWLKRNAANCLFLKKWLILKKDMTE